MHPLPEIGLKIINPTNSDGILNTDVTGLNNFSIAPKSPDDLKMPIERKSASKVGKIL